MFYEALEKAGKVFHDYTTIVSQAKNKAKQRKEKDSTEPENISLQDVPRTFPSNMPRTSPKNHICHPRDVLI